MNLLLPLASDATFWMPVQASTQAQPIDWLYYFIYWVCVFFFVGVCVTMGWFCWSYRRGSGKPVDHGLHHNLSLELAWSIPPTLLAVVMFYWGFTGFIELHTPPSNSYKIEVEAKKWDWLFKYPNGAQVAGTNPDDATEFDKGLHVPPGRPIHIILLAQDVLHAFFAPALRVKQDAVPGRYTELWFTAVHRGTKDAQGNLVPEIYPLFCAEYCGTKHSLMRSQVVVHPTQESFDNWVRVMADFRKKADGTPKSPDEIGKVLYQRVCASCHTTTNATTVGPGFGELARRLRKGESREVLEGGAKTSVQVTEQYIKDSILDPNRQIVAEVPQGGMTPTIIQQLEPDLGDLDALIAYIKTLSKD